MELSPQYLAGLFDGEAYIGVSKIRSSKTRLGFEFNPVISLSLVGGVDLLNEICVKYGGSISKIKKHHRPNSRPAEILCLHHRKVRAILSDVLPYLKLKKRQAKLVLEFFEYVPATCSDERLRKQVEIYNQLKVLNHRGTHKPELFKVGIIRPPNFNTFTKEELFNLYWKKELSMKEIAELKGCAGTTILRHMRQLNITRRSIPVATKIARNK